MTRLVSRTRTARLFALSGPTRTSGAFVVAALAWALGGCGDASVSRGDPDTNPGPTDDVLDAAVDTPSDATESDTDGASVDVRDDVPRPVDVDDGDGSEGGDTLPDADAMPWDADSGPERPDTDVLDGGSTLPSDPLCGDGRIQGAEECDDGAENSNLASDACRTSCRLPYCGDGVVDSGEDCDDGGRYGGDGCDPGCRVETGRIEVEPNNLLGDAEPLAPGEVVIGGLPESDRDCFAVDVADDGWVQASTDALGDCGGDTFLRLYRPDGVLLSTADDGAGGRCSLLNPDMDRTARYLPAGIYYVCVEGFLGTPVRTYTLSIETEGTSCEEGRFVVVPEEDRDRDGKANACDLDDDGDGVLDIEDNCPLQPNARGRFQREVTAEGDIRDWVLATWHEEGWTAPETGSCLPTSGSPFGDPATSRLRPGDHAGTVAVYTRWSDQDVVSLLPTELTTPRAALAMAYFSSPEALEAELRLGSDDGVIVWLNGTEVHRNPECRGALRDQDSVPVSIRAGMNRLTMKVLDTGGQWAAAARFVDLEGNPISNLVVYRAHEPDWIGGQQDRDGDGIGDACDPVFDPAAGG